MPSYNGGDLPAEKCDNFMQELELLEQTLPTIKIQHYLYGNREFILAVIQNLKKLATASIITGNPICWR